MASRHFGVARASGDALCAVIDSADAHAGEHVAVVFPARPQHLSQATLQELDAATRCASMDGLDLPGQRFILGFTPPLPPDEADGGIGIVVRDAHGFDRRQERWIALLPRGDAWFTACTSSEGLHLSAWPTAHVAGDPLWHAYVYLGYDTEPDCSEAQTRDAGQERMP